MKAVFELDPPLEVDVGIGRTGWRRSRRVHATSVNPADWHLMRGEPYIARLSFGLR
jgi:hypothetical protein